MPGHAYGAVITHTRVHPRRVGKYRAGHVALLGVVAGPAAGPRSGPGRGRARPAGRAPGAESASPHQKTVRDRDFQILHARAPVTRPIGAAVGAVPQPDRLNPVQWDGRCNRRVVCGRAERTKAGAAVSS